MMLEMVFVGNKNLIGEVIAINDNFTTIQVYETTTGLQVGEPIEKTNSLMSATLGPGIISNIFDGIERPLKDIEKQCGAFIDIGSNVPALDIEKLWKVTILVKEGDFLNEGQIYATTPESDLILHKCMVPPQLSGTVKSISQNGNYKIEFIMTKEEFK
ncbi:MAG: V-type ATP synthase subunit A, partial [Oscillospiraceae bacterium]